MSPETDGMCGGGSEVDADVVSDESGWRDAGVDARRSEYDMKERRLSAAVVELALADWEDELDRSDKLNGR